MPVGQSFFGEMSTPAWPRNVLAAVSDSGDTSESNSGSAQVSQRPQALASGSSRQRRRNSMRQPVVSA